LLHLVGCLHRWKSPRLLTRNTQFTQQQNFLYQVKHQQPNRAKFFFSCQFDSDVQKTVGASHIKFGTKADNEEAYMSAG